MSDATTIARRWLDELHTFCQYRWHRVISDEDFLGQLGHIPPETPEKVVDARAQKALLLLMKARLDADPTFNRNFVAQTRWKWLNQLLTVARVKELSQVKIIRKGGSTGLRYEIGDLVASFYGKQILKKLGYNVERRHIAKPDELKAVKEALSKIKLTLPEVVERTITEQFFDPEETEDTGETEETTETTTEAPTA